MKKYALLLFLFVLTLGIGLMLKNRKTYAFTSCESLIVHPSGVSTLNLKEYLEEVRYKEINYFCSYDRCYGVKEGKIENSISNYLKLYDDTLSEEEMLIVKVKGYSITEISFNVCE